LKERDWVLLPGTADGANGHCRWSWHITPPSSATPFRDLDCGPPLLVLLIGISGQLRLPDGSDFFRDGERNPDLVIRIPSAPEVCNYEINLFRDVEKPVRTAVAHNNPWDAPSIIAR
jgi:hypothetical protein